MPKKRDTENTPQVSEGAGTASPAARTEKPKRVRAAATPRAAARKKDELVAAESTNGASHSITQLAGAVGSSPAASNGLDPNEIARLAYSYWEARGCQGGSPEEDWRRAEQELRSRSATGASA
jgi:hypothetical protein